MYRAPEPARDRSRSCSRRTRPPRSGSARIDDATSVVSPQPAPAVTKVSRPGAEDRRAAGLPDGAGQACAAGEARRPAAPAPRRAGPVRRAGTVRPAGALSAPPSTCGVVSEPAHAGGRYDGTRIFPRCCAGARPTFGPFGRAIGRARRRAVRPRRAGPTGWFTRRAGRRLGEPFDGCGDTTSSRCRPTAGSPALLKATGSTQGRLQLERQVRVLVALHADPRLARGPAVPRTPGVGDVDGLHFVLESRPPGADFRPAARGGARPVIPMALETIGSSPPALPRRPG